MPSPSASNLCESGGSTGKRLNGMSLQSRSGGAGGMQTVGYAPESTLVRKKGDPKPWQTSKHATSPSRTRPATRQDADRAGQPSRGSDRPLHLPTGLALVRMHQ